MANAYKFRRLLKRSTPILLSIIGTLSFWEISIWLLNTPEYLLPRPSSISRILILDFHTIYPHALVTLLEAVCGLGISCLLGLASGYLLTYNKSLENASIPLLVALQSIPIVALAPLMMLWFGAGLLSKIAMATMLCFFPMTLNTIKGVNAIPDGARDLLKTYRTSRSFGFWHVTLPYSMPFVFSGARISAAMAMIGAIVAEYAGANKGLGYLIMQSTYRVETATLFAAIFTSAIASWLLYLSIYIIEQYPLKRFASNHGSNYNI